MDEETKVEGETCACGSEQKTEDCCGADKKTEEASDDVEN